MECMAGTTGLEPATADLNEAAAATTVAVVPFPNIPLPLRV